jgi:hypothetical protein
MFKTSISNFFRFRLALMLAIVAVAITGCNKGDDPGGGGPGPGPGGNSFITATIDGATINLTEGQNNVFAYAALTFPVDASYIASLIRPDPLAEMTVEIGNLVGTDLETPPTNAEFTSLFTTGPRDFVPDPSTEPGVSFNYLMGTDITDFYTTKTGDQTGSNFNITSVQSISVPGEVAYMRVNGTFNCKIYALMTQEMKTVTNGSFSLVFSSL